MKGADVYYELSTFVSIFLKNKTGERLLCD